MKVSVIIPCYNCKNYIKECLDSVREALTAEDEIICVDDGSTDETAELLRNISDPRLRTITQKNMGPGAARNAGIEDASGEQILFVDADDTIFSGMIQMVKAYSDDSLSNSQLCMELVRDSKKLSDDSPERLKKLKPQMILPAEEVLLDILDTDRLRAKEICRNGYDIWGPTVKTYSRAILMEKNIRFSEDLRWGEDICFNLQYLKHIRTVCFLPVKAYWYRQVTSSLIHSYYPEKHLEIQHFLKNIGLILNNENRKELEAFHFLAVKQYFYILQFDFCSRLNREPFLSRRKKAWALKDDDPMIREGLRYIKSRKSSTVIGLMTFLIRLRWFGAVDLLMKLYNKVL